MKECAAVCLPARHCPREQLNSTPPLLGWWSTRWLAATLLTTCLEATRRSQPTSFVDLPLYVSGGSPLAGHLRLTLSAPRSIPSSPQCCLHICMEAAPLHAAPQAQLTGRCPRRAPERVTRTTVRHQWGEPSRKSPTGCETSTTRRRLDDHLWGPASSAKLDLKSLGPDLDLVDAAHLAL